MFAFVVFGFSVLSQEIGWEERLRNDLFCVGCTGESNGRGAGGHAPLATWASAQNALKVAIFRLQIETKLWGGAMPPSQLVFLCIKP